MFIEKWIIAATTIAMITLIALLWRTGKQVRALRYCFIHFSDAVKREIDENEYLLDKPYADDIEGIMKRFNRTWGQQLDWSRDVMKRANLSWFSENDKHYVLED